MSYPSFTAFFIMIDANGNHNQLVMENVLERKTPVFVLVLVWTTPMKDIDGHVLSKPVGTDYLFGGTGGRIWRTQSSPEYRPQNRTTNQGSLYAPALDFVSFVSFAASSLPHLTIGFRFANDCSCRHFRCDRSGQLTFPAIIRF